MLAPAAFPLPRPSPAPTLWLPLPARKPRASGQSPPVCLSLGLEGSGQPLGVAMPLRARLVRPWSHRKGKGWGWLDSQGLRASAHKRTRRNPRRRIARLSKGKPSKVARCSHAAKIRVLGAGLRCPGRWGNSQRKESGEGSGGGSQGPFPCSSRESSVWELSLTPIPPHPQICALGVIKGRKTKESLENDLYLNSKTETNYLVRF